MLYVLKIYRFVYFGQNIIYFCVIICLIGYILKMNIKNFVKVRIKLIVQRVFLIMMKGIILKRGNYVFYEFYLLKIDFGIVLDKLNLSYFNIVIFIKIFISVNRQ